MLPSLVVAGHDVPVVAAAALGAGAGFFAGMFGIGGGFLLTPLVAILFGVPFPVAVGTGLCQMVGTALVTLLRHRSLGHGDVRFDLVMLAGSLIGVDAGARALAALERAAVVRIGGRAVPLVDVVVEPLYIAILIVAAVSFWRRSSAGSDVAGRPGPLARVRLGPRVRLRAIDADVAALVVAHVGLGVGFLSGLLGIGGGVLLLPILVYGYGFPMRQAAGTGILVLLATATVGTAVHAARGHVDLALAMTLLVGAAITAQLGARATRRLSQTALRRFFAAVIIATIAAIAWDMGRSLGRADGGESVAGVPPAPGGA